MIAPSAHSGQGSAGGCSRQPRPEVPLGLKDDNPRFKDGGFGDAGFTFGLVSAAPPKLRIWGHARFGRRRAFCWMMPARSVAASWLLCKNLVPVRLMR
jgi:hypothetical protein